MLILPLLRCYCDVVAWAEMGNESWRNNDSEKACLAMVRMMHVEQKTTYHHRPNQPSKFLTTQSARHQKPCPRVAMQTWPEAPLVSQRHHWEGLWFADPPGTHEAHLTLTGCITGCISQSLRLKSTEKRNAGWRAPQAEEHPFMIHGGRATRWGPSRWSRPIYIVLGV